MLWTLLRLQALAFWRAPHRNGRIALAALRSLGMAYAVLAAAALGFLLPDTLSVWVPDVSALVAVDHALLPALAMLTMGRVLFQDVPTRGVEAFLVLPLSRYQVARAVTLRAGVTVFNIAPIAFAIPFAARTVRGSLDGSAALVFVLGVGACVAVSHSAVVIWKTRLGAAPRETTAVVAGVAAATVALLVGTGGLLGPNAVVAAVLMAVLALGLGVYTYRCLVAALYLDPPRRRGQAEVNRPVRGFERPGLWTFIDLEWRLVQRTHFPRGIALNALMMTIGLAVVALMADVPTAPMLLFSTATLAISMGQFALPFASEHYDRLLTLPGALPAFVQAKLVLGIGSVILLGIIQAVLVLALAPGALPALGGAVLFGAGVFAPVAVWGSTLVPKPVDIHDQFMGNPRIHALLPQVVLAVTSGIGVAPFAFVGPEAGLLAMSGLGTAGVVALPLWHRVIERRVARGRYAVAQRFRSVL